VSTKEFFLKVPYVRYYLPNGPKVASYVRILTKGYPKSQCTYGGPPVYIFTKNDSVRKVVLEHTYNQKVQKSQNVLPAIPSDLKSKLII
jgi:hypothetical protein